MIRDVILGLIFAIIVILVVQRRTSRAEVTEAECSANYALKVSECMKQCKTDVNCQVTCIQQAKSAHTSCTSQITKNK